MIEPLDEVFPPYKHYGGWRANTPTANGDGFMRLERTEGFVDGILAAALLEDRVSRKALRCAFVVIEGRCSE